MFNRFLFMVSCLTFIMVLSISPARGQEVLTNAEVIALTKAGIEKSIIISKIRSSTTKFDVSTDALIQLKQAGVADDVVAAMINPKAEQDFSNSKPKKLMDELGSLFPILKNSVVTVWSDIGGHGSGFIISEEGLILTNFHVVGPSEYAAVQFNDNLKVEARILATDSERDVAVLWADISPFVDATAVKFVDIKIQPTAQEGERVIAIGSPLHQLKVMTTGVVSKVEERAILSDVNINHGNSGGPLFNSLGEVIGINAFGDTPKYLRGQGGPGLSGIIRIEQAVPVIEEAKKQIIASKKPSARLLPVEPKGDYPLDAVREVALEKKFDLKPYFFDVGKFQVKLLTPRLKYREATEFEREALKGRKNRDKKSEIKANLNPYQNLYGWAEYLGHYKPVLQIQAVPEIAETAGSLWTRALVGGLTGVMIPGGKYKYKADFYRMKLFCGNTEVEPIHPARIAHFSNEVNYFRTLKDATYFGVYTYPANAINETCGTVRIEVVSAQKPNDPQIENIKPQHIQRLALDFKPYFELKSSQAMPEE